MQYPARIDQIERAPESGDFLYPAVQQREIVEAMLRFQVARMVKAGFTDVDAQHVDLRVIERHLRRKICSTAGDEHFDVAARLAVRPEERRIKDRVAGKALRGDAGIGQVGDRSWVYPPFVLSANNFVAVVFHTKRAS